MDESLKNVIFKKITRTGAALTANNMEFHYAERKEDVPAIVESLLNQGDIVTSGGSKSLKETGVIDLLKSDKYKYLDRDAVGDVAQVEKIYTAAFSCDAYLCSANAITENGELYNVDGTCNRIAAIAFGPKSVIIVAGYNKIVKDLDEANRRIKSLCAPANAKRLGLATYCNENGQCLSLAQGKDGMTAGCDCDARICCSYLVSARQRIKNRIKVILVGEELGY